MFLTLKWWYQIREVELKLHQPSETYLPNLNSCLWFFVFCFLYRHLVFNLLSTNNENTIRFLSVYKYDLACLLERRQNRNDNYNTSISTWLVSSDSSANGSAGFTWTISDWFCSSSTSGSFDIILLEFTTDTVPLKEGIKDGYHQYK